MWDALEQPICQRATMALLHFLWQGAAIAGLLAMTLRLLRRGSAAARYAASLAAMVLMVLVPVATFVMLDGATAPSSAGALSRLPPSGGNSLVSVAEVVRAAQPFLLLAWLAGVSLLNLRLFAGYAGTLWLRGRRQPIPRALAARAGQLARHLGVAAGRVFASARAREVIAVGFWRPAVLLPLAWLTTLPPDVIEAAIAHELAHIRRWDLWANLFQRWAETLLFYHPAVWWV
ncbi:MAG: M56 family metallopeptidase, partial [Verrucomicrobiae bacterium]|nr:M56 family metallopeptidase [Verrucomicrobiae bacterium]